MDADVIVIGCGVAGLQSTISCSKMGLKTICVGKISSSYYYNKEIKDIVGILGNGRDFLLTGKIMAMNYGASIYEEDVLSIKRIKGGYEIFTEGHRRRCGKCLILAMGRIELPDFEYSGVSWVMTEMNEDIKNIIGRKVVIYGCESGAVYAAISAQKIAREVHLVSEEIRVSPQLEDDLSTSNVNIHEGKKIKNLIDDEMSVVVLSDGRKIYTDILFVIPKARPIKDIASEINLDINSISGCRTNLSDVFACGDITGKPYSIAKCIGEGFAASLLANKYVKNKMA